MKTLIKNVERMFVLLEGDDGSLVLEVAAGGIAVVEVQVRLNEEQVKRYREAGESYIADLAYLVAKHPRGFAGGD